MYLAIYSAFSEIRKECMHIDMWIIYGYGYVPACMYQDT